MCIVSSLLFERKVSTLDFIPYLLIDWQNVFLLLVKQLGQKGTHIFFFADCSTFSQVSSLGHWKSNGYFGKYVNFEITACLRHDFWFFLFQSMQKDKVLYPEMTQLHGTYTVTGIWNSCATSKVLRRRGRVPLAMPLQQSRHTLTSLQKCC